MSFILDALRKSDQQRQRSVTPTLMTAQIPAAGPTQPALWWYGMLAAALVGAGILIGWMHQGQSDSTPPATLPSAGKPPVASVQKFAPAPLPALPEAARKPEIPLPARKSPVPVATAATPSVPATKPAAPAEPVMTAAVAPSPAAKHEEHAIPDAGVMTLAELPPTIQQELPHLAILAHSYSSKPKARFVYINDRMLHEEEYPVPGLKLEQITPDGMIFSYKGYRFRRGANQ